MARTHPLVSILIPAFNAEEWIADTLRSALVQSWPCKEIIVVDDGSADRTPSIARQFASQGVRVVVQANGGASAARNTAYSLCRGDYIQWLDADDLLAPDKITEQMRVAERAGRGILLSSPWAYFAYRPHRARFIPTPLWNDLPPGEWLLRKMGENLYMQTATWLTSRELAEAAGPWDKRLCSDDDGEYFCRVLLASDGVRFVPGAGVYYRNLPSGRLSHIGTSNERMDSMLLSMKLHIEYLRSLEESERVRRACLNYIRTWSPSFFPQRPDILEELESIARELGGRVEFPVRRWKYRWAEWLFGPRTAKRMELVLPKFKARMQCAWDKQMRNLERRSDPASAAIPSGDQG